MCVWDFVESRTASTAALHTTPPTPASLYQLLLKTQQLAGRRLSRGWYDRGAPASTTLLSPLHAHPPSPPSFTQLPLMTSTSMLPPPRQTVGRSAPRPRMV